MNDLIVYIIIAIVINIIIFLICREIVCWYFKINERIGLQEETNGLLRQILSGMKEPGNGSVVSAREKSISGPATTITPNLNREETIKASELNFTEKMHFDVLRFSEEEVIVLSKNGREFEIISQANWEKMLENGEASQYFRVLVNE